MPKSKFANETSTARQVEERIRQRMSGWSLAERRRGGFGQWHRALAATCATNGNWVWFVDQFSRAVAAAAIVGRMLQAEQWPAEVHDWLVGSADPITVEVFREARAQSASLERMTTIDAETDARTDAALYWVETYLATVVARERMRRGVFFTPRRVARYIVHQVDQRLRDEFGCRYGFASWMPTERGGALEPALGSGVFLCEIFGQLEANLREWRREQASCGETIASLDGRDARRKLDGISRGNGDGEWTSAWTAIVERWLPSIVGFELILANAVVARLVIADQLFNSGVRWPLRASPRIYVTNSLGDAGSRKPANVDSSVWHDVVVRAEQARFDERFAIVIGNPPFSGLSQNRSRFAERLLHGRDPADAEVASYFQVDGQRLAERKHWLHDDYVKFLRYAHWQIERRGAGVLGFVTNHGYLENATMRGVRWQLARTFSRIDLLDLHGNRKKLEINPAGEIDEGVFTVDQGAAVAVMSRSPDAGAHSAIRYAELWGRRAEKLAALQSNDANSNGNATGSERILWREHTPTAPFYFFSPRLQTESAEYWQAMKLTDVMPVNSTAAVTARDRFVIAHACDELQTRLADLADPELTDDQLRDRYFRRTRSNRYPAGNTRGWRLADARLRLKTVSDVAAIPRPCQYRPFDRRWIAWADWLIDWPRSETMRHMLDRDNVALIARRQSPASRPGDYVFVADGPVIDGLIRSDNRGSESFFPLYLNFAAPAESDLGERTEVNFSRTFLDQLGRALAGSAPDLTHEARRPELPPASAIFGFIYAQLQSREYGRLFGESLQIDFPRIFLPTGRAVFDTLAALGERLVDVHRLRGVEFDEDFATLVRENADSPPRVGAGFPKYQEGRVYLNAECWFDGVDAAVWSTHIGAWQPCRKWLTARQGRPLTIDDVNHYGRIVACLAETQHLRDRIDAEIGRAGGWFGAMRSSPAIS